MALFESKKTKAVADANHTLSQRVAELEAMMTPQMRDYDYLCQVHKQKQQEFNYLLQQLQQVNSQLQAARSELQAAQEQLVQAKEKISQSPQVASSVSKSASNPSPPKSKISGANQLSFEAAGVFAKTKEILSIAEKNWLFRQSDEVVIEKYKGRKIYQAYFRNLNTELVPEPTNPYDRNAIMVVVNGVCVGYVPAELCDKVKKIISRPYLADTRISGGVVKYVEDGIVIIKDYGYDVQVKICN